MSATTTNPLEIQAAELHAWSVLHSIEAQEKAKAGDSIGQRHHNELSEAYFHAYLDLGRRS